MIIPFRPLGQITLLCILSSCVPAPEKLAPSANSTLPLKKKFETSIPASSNLANSLLKLFPTPQAKQFVNTALENNPSLLSSLSRIKQAELNVQQSKTARKPILNASSNLGRLGNANRSAGRYAISANASWEIDVWKKIDTEVSALENALLIRKFNHQAARQSIAAQTLQAWITLVEANKLVTLANEQLKSFKKTKSLVERKFELGTGGLDAVHLADTDLASSKADLESATNQRNQASRSLTRLLGDYPSASLKSTQWPSSLKNVRTSTPSSLLTNRPDIQAAFLSIQAADIDVTIAHKDLLPDFRITSSLGQQSNILKNLADSQFNSWSLLANLSAPILDGGRRKLEIAIQQEEARQSIHDYRSAVLNALLEVENALGSESVLAQRELHLRNALDAVTKAEERLLGQYERGLVDILSLLDTQRRRFNAEQRLINTQADRYINRITLALAVGTSI